MKLPLSNRLLACCQFVRSGDRVADIGCDHGYLGIHLLKNDIAASVIASDVNEGPLQSAIINAHKYGVKDKIRFYLSDGVQNIPREFDCMVCAGMGADTMISILEAAPWLKAEQYRMILQCQSKTPVLRQYLAANGWKISREEVLRDGRFLYTVMDVVREDESLSPGQCYISPALLQCQSPEKQAYIDWVIAHLRLAVTSRGESADTFQMAALKELEIIPQEETI